VTDVFKAPSLKLGRKAVKRDSRTLAVGNYLTAALPPPPVSINWTGGVTSFGQMLNDKLGCCTISGGAHAIQTLTLAATGKMVTVDDAAILSLFEKWDGYDPTNSASDNGGIELDVLNSWHKNTFAGHALDAFADPDVTNVTEVKQSIALFGGLYIGLDLPKSAQAQVGGLWDVEPWYRFGPLDPSWKPGSWGGHCVWICGYDATGLTCITWGALQQMSWGFWKRYVDEAHALLSPDFIKATGLSASGFNLSALQADLGAIK